MGLRCIPSNARMRACLRPRIHGRTGLRVHASRRSEGGFQPREGSERRKMMQQFVREVQPALMEQFAETAPSHVTASMERTVTNLLGTLPPAYFTVTVSTLGENLAQLMYSVLLTGYLFRNAQYRLDLQNSLAGLPVCNSPMSGTVSPNSEALASSSSCFDAAVGASEAASSSSSSCSSSYDSFSGSLGSAGSSVLDAALYAPGTQKSRVSGVVLAWHRENGIEEICAVDYIQRLEAENERLRQALATGTAALTAAPPPRTPRTPEPVRSTPAPPLLAPGAGAPAAALALRGEELPNELLEYLRGLEPASLAELTSSASAEVTEAMDAFVQRLLGTRERDALRGAASECNAQELGRLLFWLMVVGYTLRSMEVRLEMDGALQVSSTARDEGGSGGGGWQGLPPARP